MKIIAHRSGPTFFPEQTVQSARLALENGADMIELDVRLTCDGKIAVSHDLSVERVFGAERNVSDLTAVEFLALRHKNAPAFGSHLFEHYLASGIAKILIHIKEDALIDALLDMILSYDLLNEVVFGVHSTVLAEHIKMKCPTARVLAFMPTLEDLIAFGKSSVDYIRLWEQWAEKRNVDAIRSYGKEVWVMTNGIEVGASTDDQIKAILSLGVDGILINDICHLQRLL